MLGNQAPFYVRRLYLKNFRCFSQTTIDLEAPLILIDGKNGSGKTTVLEALHYVCYLRSFRTHSPADVIQNGSDGFFIKAWCNEHEVQVGYADKKRLVKVNNQTINSYKELLDYYRTITLTEYDLALINESPDIRRSFLDAALLLYDPTFITTLREFRHIVDSRSKLLRLKSYDRDAYIVWTQQLWHHSRHIQEKRRALIASLEEEVNQLLATYFPGQYAISFKYIVKMLEEEQSWPEFMHDIDRLYADEQRYCRNLFGAHLDDLQIKFQDKRSKAFASRGQQKLIVLLLKIAHVRRMTSLRGPVIFLLDDFLTDFDYERAQIFLELLATLGAQLIFTSPLTSGFMEERLKGMGAHHVKLPY